MSGESDSVQPTRFRTGLPGTHLPAHRENRTASGAQPQIAETDLYTAEGRQDEEN